MSLSFNQTFSFPFIYLSPPFPQPHSIPPSSCLPLEINFTLHYQSESLQTKTHRRNHTNRLHTWFQWAFPPGLTYFNQYKHMHIYTVSPFVLNLKYCHETRKINGSRWCKCHEASHYGLLRREDWDYTHTDKMRINYNERPEGHWWLLNNLKSQRFFNKSSPKANFCHWDWHCE